MRHSNPYGFRYRLARFFAGRNGADALYYLAFSLSLIFIFLSGIFYAHSVLKYLFPALYLLAFGYALFRMLSRNVTKRQRENAAFRRAMKSLFMPLRRTYLRIRDRKTHLYRKCPYCKSTLRLARIPGDHIVRCPSCGERFPVKVKKQP
ncbi:MAG: hypothetical protein E7609_06120 [Ruminococcaceae bacterium]|nr:hypothetical protein [Oscillospiraceae bacterium]